MKLTPYRTAIAPDWIDFNGHLRDAYYGLVLSHALDALMDEVGLDAAYRGHTQCTLYTLELHLHYLHEVKQSDDLVVTTSILDTDAKRVHVGCRFTCARVSEPVAVGEAMLLHVHQGAKPASAALPGQIARRLDALKVDPDARNAWGPQSRKIELKRRSAG